METLSNQKGPILLTGHTGFKGTWLALLLEKIGLPVVGMSLPAEENSLYSRLGKQNYQEEFFEDIRDFSQVTKIVRKIKPSIIFHLAAQPLVLESYRNPRQTFETNVIGTANLLDAFFSLESSKLFLGITTDKVYKNDNLGRKFTENDPLAGKDPYSASKVGAESALAAWKQMSLIQNGPTVLSVRAGNVIGGGDFAQDRIVPDIVRGIIGNKKILIRNPNSTRPWQHVLDPLYGYLLAADKALGDKLPEAYNFGPNGESLSVNQLVEIAKSTWNNKKIELAHGSGTESTEAKSLALNSSKAHNELNWKPVWTQENAIVDTFKWWERVTDKKMSALDACEFDLETLAKGKNAIN